MRVTQSQTEQQTAITYHQAHGYFAAKQARTKLHCLVMGDM